MGVKEEGDDNPSPWQVIQPCIIFTILNKGTSFTVVHPMWHFGM